MQFYNLKDHNQQVSFMQAVKQGLASQQGLFFPRELVTFTPTEIEQLLNQDFIERSSQILAPYLADDVSLSVLRTCLTNAWHFPIKVQAVNARQASVELFHGPTLAFKDFGARFMAQMLSLISQQQPMTILTATSGDTGAAVAHALAGIENIEVVILYPQGKISRLQEKLFCTLGGNIHTIAVDGDFDDCQRLVKQSFDDPALCKELSLNSANSINISRLLAQICYYFEAVAQLSIEQRQQLVVAVPSGNFGNLTAGLLAQVAGLPIKRFIAATNSNDTVVRYLQTGDWQPDMTKTTLSNAMDVSQPNNWPRVEEIFRRKQGTLKPLTAIAVDDEQTRGSLRDLAQQHYLAEPHAAVAFYALNQAMMPEEYGLFLATAHPAKFKETVDSVLSTTLPLPTELANCQNLPLLSVPLAADFSQLKAFLLKTCHK